MLIIFFLRIKIDVTQFLINTASLKKEKKKEITKAHLRENKITYLSRFPFPLQKLQLAWLQKRPLRLFSNSLHFARKYGNVTDIRFLLLPRPVTSQHDFRHRFASRFTVRSHANRFLIPSCPLSWINFNRSFTCFGFESNVSRISRLCVCHEDGWNCPNIRLLSLRKTEEKKEISYDFLNLYEILEALE